MTRMQQVNVPECAALKVHSSAHARPRDTHKNVYAGSSAARACGHPFAATAPVPVLTPSAPALALQQHPQAQACWGAAGAAAGGPRSLAGPAAGSALQVAAGAAQLHALSVTQALRPAPALCGLG